MKKARNQNRNPIKLQVCWTLILLLCFSMGCKDKIEGCRDIKASNWDAAADSSCEECCTYPTLNLSFSHTYGDTTFRYREPYEDDALNVYSIISIRYFLSGFSITAGSEEFIVTDSLETTLIQNGVTGSATIHDDAVFASVGTSTTAVGDFPTNDLFLDSLSFCLGLDQPLNSVDPDAVPSTHPLAPRQDTMYWDESRGYIFQRLAIVRDTAVRDTLILEIGGDDYLKKVNLAYGKTTLVGFNTEIPIRVDYKCWFTGINFAMDTEAELKEKIVNNMSNCFSISE